MKRSTVTRHGRTFTVIELEPIQKQPKSKASRVKFVQVPVPWIEKLADQTAATHKLALLILLLDFRHYRHPVKLSNEVTKHLRMDRKTKRQSLRRLAALGLISVELKSGSAPLVTVIR
jgi:hypothetical protein